MQAHDEHQMHRGSHDQHGMNAAAGETVAGAHAAHNRHAGHSVEMFRNRFWVCLALTIPVLLYAEMLWDWLGLNAPDLPGGNLMPLGAIR